MTKPLSISPAIGERSTASDSPSKRSEGREASGERSVIGAKYRFRISRLTRGERGLRSLTKLRFKERCFKLIRFDTGLISVMIVLDK